MNASAKSFVTPTYAAIVDRLSLPPHDCLDEQEGEQGEGGAQERIAYE